jgi:group I intron endonuclease
MRCGIYKITNKVNGKCIIGSSVNMESRLACHKSILKDNKHYNTYLQHSWNKYGEDNFIFEIINLCDKENLLEFEDYFIAAFDSGNRDGGYNLKGATRPARFRKLPPITEETRKKMSLSQTGRKHSEETKKKMTLWKRPKVPEERKKIISAYRKGVRTTPIGFKRKEESNRKQSESMMGHIPWNKGKTGIYSEETIEKIRQAAIKQHYIKKEKLNVAP